MMKHLKSYLPILALSATLALTACSSDELPADPSFDQDIKTELVDKSQLPGWLADYVTYLEYVPENQPLPSETAGIYRFEWNDKTFYEISTSTQNSMHQDLYDADGNRIILEDEDYKSLSEGAKNWTIVYLLKYTHENPFVYPVNIEDPEAQLFFQNLMADGKMNNGIKFEPDAIHNNTFYIITTPLQYTSIYAGADSLPAIDFNQYSLIVGVAHVPRGAYLKRQEMTPGDVYFHPTLRLYYEKPLGASQGIGENNSTSYFYALYPKLPSEMLNVSLSINHHEVYKERCGYLTLDISSVFFPISSDWESSLKELKSIPQKDFLEMVKGYGWQEVSFHKLNEDGTYNENVVWTMGGMPIHCYEFNSSGNTVTDYWRNTNPSHGKSEDHLMYSHQNNMVYIGHRAEFQVISIEGDRMEAVKRLHVPSTKLGEYRDISYVVILRRLSDKELQAVKEQYNG